MTFKQQLNEPVTYIQGEKELIAPSSINNHTDGQELILACCHLLFYAHDNYLVSELFSNEIRFCS